MKEGGWSPSFFIQKFSPGSLSEDPVGTLLCVTLRSPFLGGSNNTAEGRASCKKSTPGENPSEHEVPPFAGMTSSAFFVALRLQQHSRRTGPFVKKSTPGSRSEDPVGTLLCVTLRSSFLCGYNTRPQAGLLHPTRGINSPIQPHLYT
jgi:hypothetical protein